MPWRRIKPMDEKIRFISERSVKNRDLPLTLDIFNHFPKLYEKCDAARLLG